MSFVSSISLNWVDIDINLNKLYSIEKKKIFILIILLTNQYINIKMLYLYANKK